MSGKRLTTFTNNYMARSTFFPVNCHRKHWGDITHTLIKKIWQTTKTLPITFTIFFFHQNLRKGGFCAFSLCVAYMSCRAPGGINGYFYLDSYQQTAPHSTCTNPLILHDISELRKEDLGTFYSVRGVHLNTKSFCEIRWSEKGF